MFFDLNEAALTAGVVAVLWALSVSSWVVILYKTWWIWRAGRDIPAAQRAFWQSPDPHQAHQALAVLDRQALLQPLTSAALSTGSEPAAGAPGWTDDRATRQRQVLISLRQVTQQLQWGQPWLACVASIAPFVGLLGTVWGLLDAMSDLPAADQAAWQDWVPALSHSLHLTALGLCVAVPALLAHHLMAPRLSALQSSIEDFTADLMEQVHSDPHA